MAIETLDAASVGAPDFETNPAGDAAFFGLSSHDRAHSALDFALSTDAPGYNVFVLGPDRAGRMTATLDYLSSRMAKRDAPADWVYLANFRRMHRPKPYRLPAGTGRRLRVAMANLIAAVREALKNAFESEAWQKEVKAETDRVNEEVGRRIAAVRQEAAKAGLELRNTGQGEIAVLPVRRADGEAEPSADELERMRVRSQELSAELEAINRWAGRQQAEVMGRIHESERRHAGQAIAGAFEPVDSAFSALPGIARWLAEAREDMLEGLGRFRTDQRNVPQPASEVPERRYAVNLFVDHADDRHPTVVVETDPTPQALFGRIEYRQVGGSLETDLTLLGAGAIHRANGGVLVLRAEVLARHGESWERLKGALRDREAGVVEASLTGQVPIAGAPRPKPIPLDLKVVIVGAPFFYYGLFARDPGFDTHFRVKADIDPDMPADEENLRIYAGMLEAATQRLGRAGLTRSARRYLLGLASRWAGHRAKLTAQIELFDDLLAEAVSGQAPNAELEPIDKVCIIAAIEQRRYRNSRIEDRVHERISDGTVHIATSGRVHGQVNALVVQQVGEHVFGSPSRVTARCSVGRRGVVNIEREIAMGGPIQQKGVLVIQGYLAGHFARHMPLSCNASITFEQSYGGVEGDSASMAELVAVISDLAGLPVRQDLAITGSVDQHGRAQAVGGVPYKIEGFYRACRDGGDALTGTQGVIVPATCKPDLILNEEVVAAVEAGKFAVHAVSDVTDALELLLGEPAGEVQTSGAYPDGTIFRRVADRLAAFDKAMRDRN